MMSRTRHRSNLLDQRRQPAMIRWLSVVAILASLACAADGIPIALAAEAAIPPQIQAIVDSPDRTKADREMDPRRHPAEMLTFFGVKPGMAVLDIGTGRGYTAELLARAVGPGGSVVAQNDPLIFERFMK